jgi:phosphatidylserine decarboxylase
MPLSETARSKVYRLYSWVTGADLSEVGSPLEAYLTLGEFFARELLPGARTIDPSALVCPCDGKVLSYGVVENDTLEHIKGGTYSLTQFLTGSAYLREGNFIPKLKSKAETKLYYVTFYLAPGDYHRFHAPTDLEIMYRSHLHGYLLGVFPLNLWRKKGIYEINERVVYFGKWAQGFLSYVAVGAYNVGSIKINFDSELVTNKASPAKSVQHLALTHTLQKGQEIGSFNMGSTIVLVFEGSHSLQWQVTEGQTIKMGQALAS